MPSMDTTVATMEHSWFKIYRHGAGAHTAVQHCMVYPDEHIALHDPQICHGLSMAPSEI
jgi:hypothetical protein